MLGPRVRELHRVAVNHDDVDVVRHSAEPGADSGTDIDERAGLEAGLDAARVVRASPSPTTD